MARSHIAVGTCFFSGYPLYHVRSWSNEYQSAYTGAFHGTFRVGAIIRDQSFGIDNVGDYKTGSLYIDAPLIKGLGKYDWIGIGSNIVFDEAGTIKLKTVGFAGSVAYHLAFNKERSTVITLGAQFGSNTRRFDLMRPILRINLFLEEILLDQPEK